MGIFPRILSVLAAVPVILSCTAGLDGMAPEGGMAGTADRILNTSVDAVPGKLIFFVEDGSVPGSEEMAEALSAISATSV